MVEEEEEEEEEEEAGREVEEGGRSKALVNLHSFCWRARSCSSMGLLLLPVTVLVPPAASLTRAVMSVGCGEGVVRKGGRRVGGP